MKTAIIEKEGKFYKECGVVMLESNIQSPVYFIRRNDKPQNQHLYFTSDDGIKKGDWCHDIRYNSIFQSENDSDEDVSKYFKKIIATTDKLNTHPNIADSYRSSNCVPQLSDKFIQAFIKAYNKKNKINKILVEYEKFPDGFDLEDGIQFSYTLKLKDNYIITKYIDKKDELKNVLLEVMNLGMSLRQDQISGHSSESGNEVLDEWIEENHKLLETFF